MALFKIIAVIITLVGLVIWIDKNNLDDGWVLEEDDDLEADNLEKYYQENFPNPCCQHSSKSDIVVGGHVTCEEVYTVCDDCCEVLEKRLDC